MLITSLAQEVNIIGSVGLSVCPDLFDSCLFVCLFVCKQHSSKCYKWIAMKFYGGIQSGDMGLSIMHCKWLPVISVPGISVHGNLGPRQSRYR